VRWGVRRSFAALGALALCVIASAPSQAGTPNSSDPQTGFRIANGQVPAQLAGNINPESISLDIRWSGIEPCEAGSTPVCDDYSWNSTDNAFAAFRQQGLDISNVRVTGPPSWATGRCHPTPPGTPHRRAIAFCPVRPNHYSAFQEFVRALVTRYGPGTASDVESFSWDNEPNIPKNWGGSRNQTKNAHEYSDQLVHFSAGAKAANPSVRIVAGEVAAGSAAPSQGGGDRVKAWARDFTQYSHDQGRDGDFDALAIHAYSEVPRQVQVKIDKYYELPGNHPISVTEFGWATRGPHNPNGWHCVRSEARQAHDFAETIKRVREHIPAERIRSLVWFNGLDNAKDKAGVPCGDTDTKKHPGGWYTGGPGNLGPDQVNTYGIFKRPRNGEIGSANDAVARCIAPYLHDAVDGDWDRPEPLVSPRCK
jgi:Glycosyl hydrolase catalytic core